MAWVETLPSGKYRGMYRDGRKRKVSAGTFTHKKTARDAAIDAEAKVLRNGWRDPRASKITWAQWHDQWWDSRAVEASTKKNEASMVKCHIMPEWKDVPLGAITRHDVQAWANKLKVSPGTRRRILNVFVSSLTAAVDAEIIDSNPAMRAKIAPVGPPRHVYLTQEQYAALRDAFPEEWRPVLDFLTSTGVRWGEMAGLHWEHLGADQLQVINVVSAGKIKPYPKGRRKRLVPIPEWARTEIDWQDEGIQPLEYIDEKNKPTTGLVFLTDQGASLDNRNFAQRVFEPAVEKAKLTNLGLHIHDLRHTYASWLIQSGVPLERVSELLGHASVKTTMIYAHLLPPTLADISHALPAPHLPKTSAGKSSAA